MPTASVADPPSCLAVTRHALTQHALEQRRKLTVYGSRPPQAPTIPSATQPSPTAKTPSDSSRRYARGNRI
jgi:hypothetical protein